MIENDYGLFDGYACVTLTTVMPDGQPQSSIVWVDYDGVYVLINTTLERQKGHKQSDFIEKFGRDVLPQLKAKAEKVAVGR